MEEHLGKKNVSLSNLVSIVYWPAINVLQTEKDDASQDDTSVLCLPNYWMHVPLLFGHLAWNLIRSNRLIIGLRNSAG